MNHRFELLAIEVARQGSGLDDRIPQAPMNLVLDALVEIRPNEQIVGSVGKPILRRRHGVAVHDHERQPAGTFRLVRQSLFLSFDVDGRGEIHHVQHRHLT